MDTKTAAIENKFTRYQVLVIVLIASHSIYSVLDFYGHVPLGDMLMKSMELTTKQFGLAVSVYAFSAGTSGLLTAGFATGSIVKNCCCSFM
jgi:predicted MFS family arabinose efflux permease